MCLTFYEIGGFGMGGYVEVIGGEEGVGTQIGMFLKSIFKKDIQS